MTKLESLDKLRDWIRHLDSNTHLGVLTYQGVAGLEGIAHAIQAEVDERYMELPVDADGEPIHVGDYLQLGDTRGEVVELTYCPANGELPWEWQCDTGDWYNTVFARHVKPRTVEDVLNDLADMPERIDRIAAIPRFASELRMRDGE